MGRSAHSRGIVRFSCRHPAKPAPREERRSFRCRKELHISGSRSRRSGLSSPDLLADRLLQDGDPDPETVRSAAPPMASAEKNPRTWTTFVGTKEAYDVTPVYRSGNTRTYHPVQYFAGTARSV